MATSDGVYRVQRLSRGVYPEPCKILRCLFVSLRVSAQNDRKRRAQNDRKRRARNDRRESNDIFEAKQIPII